MIYHPSWIDCKGILNLQFSKANLYCLEVFSFCSIIDHWCKVEKLKFYSIKLHYKCAKRILLAGNVDTCHHRWNNHFCCSSPAHQTPSKKEHLCILIFRKKKRTCKKCVRFHVANVKQQEKGRFWYNPIRWINLTLNYFNQNK